MKRPLILLSVYTLNTVGEQKDVCIDIEINSVSFPDDGVTKNVHFDSLGVYLYMW